MQKSTSETQQIKPTTTEDHTRAITVIQEQEAELQLHTVSISAVTFDL